MIRFLVPIELFKIDFLSIKQNNFHFHLRIQSAYITNKTKKKSYMIYTKSEIFSYPYVEVQEVGRCELEVNQRDERRH